MEKQHDTDLVASTATCLSSLALQPYTLYSKGNDKEASGTTMEIIQQQSDGGGDYRQSRQ